MRTLANTIRFTLAIICALAVYPIGPVGASGQEKPQLVFVIVPTKERVKMGDEVKFKFELRNEGRTDVLVSRAFVLNYYVSLEIVGPDAVRAPWCGRIITRHPGPREFVILKPGAKVSTTLVISCSKNRTRGFSIERAGEYTVSGDYHLPQPIEALEPISRGAPIGKGPFKANPVKFQVTARE